MAGFVDIDITADEEQLIQDAFDRLAIAFETWEPRESQLDVAVIEECNRAAAVAARSAADVSVSIFREFGKDVIGLDPIDGEPAAMTSTWTAVDDLGYTIEEDTIVAYRVAGDDLWLFRVTAETVIAPGDTVANGVPLEATEVGVFANGIANATVLELVTSLDWVDNIVSSSESAAGVDAESDATYLNRLAEELTLQSPRPILPGDFSKIARRVEGVHRALTVDGYDPTGPSSGNERMVTVAAVDTEGVDVDAGIKTTISDTLEALRELNFVVHTMSPTYTDIAIVFEAVADDDYDPADVEAAAVAAVEAWLSPASWAGGSEDPPEWRLETTVRYLEVAAVINAVAGVDYVTSLTLEKNGGGASAADKTLDGEAPLPSPVEVGGSTVTGTVT